MVNLSRTGVVNLNRTKLVRQNRTEVVNEIGLCTKATVCSYFIKILNAL